MRRAATTPGTNAGSFAPDHRDEAAALDLTVAPTPAASPGSHLPDVRPTDNTYWGEGGCGAMALAFVSLHPGLKIGVEWGTGHDEGLVWHTSAYDPATGRSFDFNGTDDIDLVLGNFDGTVEMDVDPARVAKAMRLNWNPDNPWDDDTVYDAAMAIGEHWGDSDSSDTVDEADQGDRVPHTQVA